MSTTHDGWGVPEPEAKATEPTRFALALDVGGTNVRAAVIGSDYSIADGIARTRVPFVAPGVADADQLVEVVADLIAPYRRRFGDLPIGLGMCGNIDRATGVATLVPNLGLRGLPIVALLEKRLGMPVVAATDTHLAALAEARWGAGVGHANFAWVTIGTGYGLALVLGGRLYEGQHGTAGNIGHSRFDPRASTPCGCGQVGCVETTVAGPGIARLAREAVAAGTAPSLANLADKSLSAAAVTSAAAAGDEAAEQIVSTMVEATAASLAATVNMLDLSLLVFGGGVVNAAQWLVGRIDDALRPLLMTSESRRDLQIATESFPDATLWGAAALVFFGW